MSTYSASAKDIKNDWYLVDATDQTLGRLASFIATRLRGKHKPDFTPHMDTGDYIVVINAGQIKVTGNKEDDKKYYHHSGYTGGIKEINFKDFMAKSPAKVLTLAVKGMLPKGPLGRAQLKKLKIFADANHTHQAQQPQPLNIED